MGLGLSAATEPQYSHLYGYMRKELPHVPHFYCPPALCVVLDKHWLQTVERCAAHRISFLHKRQLKEK